jgi:hypothetical protein
MKICLTRRTGRVSSLFLRNFVAKVDKPSVAKAAEGCRTPKRFAPFGGRRNTRQRFGVRRSSAAFPFVPNQEQHPGVPRETGRENGFSLIECLAYIALLVMVLGFATKIFFQSWDDSNALRRNADDIVRVLHAGDQWRADVRAATGPVQLTDAAGVEQLRIPAFPGDIVYTFSNGELRRQAGAGAASQAWLSNVKSSQMQSDSQQDVMAWRWELELKTARRATLFRPLFTFETVAGGAIIR